jgi:hypothetical protein
MEQPVKSSSVVEDPTPLSPEQPKLKPTDSSLQSATLSDDPSLQSGDQFSSTVEDPSSLQSSNLSAAQPELQSSNLSAAQPELQSATLSADEPQTIQSATLSADEPQTIQSANLSVDEPQTIQSATLSADEPEANPLDNVSVGQSSSTVEDPSLQSANLSVDPSLQSADLSVDPSLQSANLSVDPSADLSVDPSLQSAAQPELQPGDQSTVEDSSLQSGDQSAAQSAAQPELQQTDESVGDKPAIVEENNEVDPIKTALMEQLKQIEEQTAIIKSQLYPEAAGGGFNKVLKKRKKTFYKKYKSKISMKRKNKTNRNK